MEKITQAMNPQFEDEKPIDPFDFWSGANFKLKIRKVDGYQNYDLSEFDAPSPLFEDDDKMEQIWKGEHSLLEIIDPKNFKSYDELKTKLDRVLGLTSPNVSRSNTMDAVKKQHIEEKEDEIDSLMNAKSSDSDDDSFESEDFFRDLFDEE
jgi:hypothetical protein